MRLGPDALEARLAAVERALAAALARIAALETRPERPALLVAIAAQFTFATAAEIIAEGQRQADRAAGLGLAAPDLPRELRRARADTPHRLGRWLARHGATKIKSERGGTLWHFNQYPATMKPHETADPLKSTQQTA